LGQLHAVPKVSPTNLSKELAISKNTLYAYLDILEKFGLIRKYLPHGSSRRTATGTVVFDIKEQQWGRWCLIYFYGCCTFI